MIRPWYTFRNGISRERLAGAAVGTLRGIAILAVALYLIFLIGAGLYWTL